MVISITCGRVYLQLLYEYETTRPVALGKVNRRTMFFYLAVATCSCTAKISLGRNVSIFMKRETLYKNAINRAINTSFVSVCILICISLKLPDNNHVKV